MMWQVKQQKFHFLWLNLAGLWDFELYEISDLKVTTFAIDKASLFLTSKTLKTFFHTFWGNLYIYYKCFYKTDTMYLIYYTNTNHKWFYRMYIYRICRTGIFYIYPFLQYMCVKIFSSTCTVYLNYDTYSGHIALI